MRQLHTLEEQTQSLADYLPGGRLFIKKNTYDSNFRKFLRGLAGEIFRSDGYLRLYAEEILPDQTTLFLDEWEQALGIPDDCFPGTGTQDERRTHILTKLAALGVQTVEDFQELALIFGKTVTIYPLSALGNPPYDVPFFPVGLPSARFVIIVEGVDLVTNVPPYDVPFSLNIGDSILQCLFNKLKPANTRIIFRNTN